MQDRPFLGDVDLLTLEHRVAAFLEPGGPGEGEEELHGLGVDQILRVIEVDAQGVGGEGAAPLGVAGEELPEIGLLHLLLVLGEGLPFRQLVDAGAGRGGGSI